MPDFDGGILGHIQDTEAINKYIVETPTKTEQARALRDEWIVWYDDLSFWEKNLDDDILDEARNRRNDFNEANATTFAEHAQVRDVIEHGMSTEQMRGDTDRRLSDGSLPKHKKPWVPWWAKIAAVLGVGVVGAAWVGKKVYIDRFLPK